MQQTALYRNVPLVALWLGQGLSTLGSGIYSVALAWEVVRLTNSTLAMGTVLVATIVPKLIMSFFGGALGDRIAKKRILQWTDGLQCSLSVAWGLSLLWREPSLSEFYVFAILSGIVHAFFAPAYSSLLPELIRRQQVSRAVTVNLLVFRFAVVVAPIIGGWLVIALPFAAIILVNAFSYGVAFVSNQFLPHVPRNEKRKEPLLTSIRSGMSYFVQQRALLWSIVLITFANIAAVTLNVNLAQFVQRDLAWSAEAYGVVMSCYGGGAVIALVLLSVYPLQSRQGLVYIATLIGGGVVMAMMPFVTEVWQLGCLTLLVGGLFSVTSSISTIILQRDVAEDYRSRMASIATISSLLSPVGYVLWGALGDSFGNRFVFISAGIVIMIVGGIGTMTALRRYTAQQLVR